MLDFGLNAPMHAKFNRGVNKRVVRHAARNWLPPEIAGGKKVGFGMPAFLWEGAERMLQGGAVADLFKWSKGNEEEIYAMIAEDRFAVFHLVSLEMWIRIFCWGERPEQCTEALMSCDT
jgi:asparagine synthase (glutamine-hydrolysing)